jgi:hypothetical protein
MPQQRQHGDRAPRQRTRGEFGDDRAGVGQHSHTQAAAATAAAISRNTCKPGTTWTRMSAPITTPGRVALINCPTSGPPTCPLCPTAQQCPERDLRRSVGLARTRHRDRACCGQRRRANRPAPPVLHEGDRSEPEALTRASSIWAGLALRARLVLLGADDLANAAIARSNRQDLVAEDSRTSATRCGAFTARQRS